MSVQTHGVLIGCPVIAFSDVEKRELGIGNWEQDELGDDTRVDQIDGSKHTKVSDDYV